MFLMMSFLATGWKDAPAFPEPTVSEDDDTWGGRGETSSKRFSGRGKEADRGSLKVKGERSKARGYREDSALMIRG